ncbi:MAG: leucine--tRNA ligase [Gemmatimonadetes bacterium]|nr:MAG: leucine--tRNA ligase [Gemmatimonadota bacterium]
MTQVPSYDPQAVEARWQARWATDHTNEPDLDRPRRPFYNLMMFPYPSAEGLHVGNMFAFTGADIYGRFRRLQGHDVFEPIGFDAFGIHSENYALAVGTHPAKLIPQNIATFRRQLRRFGGMFDWRHELSTTDPRYYKWTQWIFVQLFKAGIAFRKKAAVNWCPKDMSVVANEQVIDGYCERHPDTRVEQRFLEQWFFAITRYAERLLKNLDRLDWSESTRTLQRNWIGRSEGAELVFETPAGQKITVFTTRPDTIFGATYMVLAPEHPLVDALTADEQRRMVNAYRREVQAKDIVSRKVVDKAKSGVFLGSYARNPATGESIAVWIADYVLMEYGTGAIMAVPAHDRRDFEFATAFKLPIRPVVRAAGDGPLPTVTEDGVLMNSGEFDGLSCQDGGRRIVAWLQSKGLATPQVQYRLHDWCISRQRYWGPPIPIIYCDRCGPVAVPERDLPVELPFIEDPRPDASGVSPLARHKEWYFVKCPRCGATGRRETDVSDTFLDSAWYFLRYPSTEFDDRPWDPARTKTWLPVTTYIGGNEHAVLHLLYSRFVTMALQELGHVHFDEPFPKLRAHGLIIKDGAKMSKSRGNVVIPDAYIQKWGADTFRMYLMFLGPFQEGGDFRETGIIGIRRFLDKVWQLTHEAALAPGVSPGPPASPGLPPEVQRKQHQTIRKVTADTAALNYNTAIAAMMEYVNLVREQGAGSRRAIEPLLVMLAPYAPHLAEELWAALGHERSIFTAAWPTYDEKLAAAGDVEIVVQVNGKVRGRLTVSRGATEAQVVALAMTDESIKRFVDGKPVRKTVYVQDRLLNLVV